MVGEALGGSLVSFVCFFLRDKLTADGVGVQRGLHNIRFSLGFVYRSFMPQHMLCAVLDSPDFCFQNTVFVLSCAVLHDFIL